MNVRFLALPRRGAARPPARLAAALAALALTIATVPAAAQTPAPADSARRASPTRGLPLETARTIEFTTREGTWISLDVTPDGRSIVFELLGDLYRVPIAGGKATRVTHGLAYDAQPRVSPDGEWLAFISDRDGADNLWIARLDGSEPRKLSNETQVQLLSPVWSPDGRYVLVSRRATPAELRMYHVDGGTGVTLPAPPGGGGGAAAGGAPARPAGNGPAFSPDGRYLYYVRPPAGGGSFPTHQIARRDMESGDVDVITQAEWGAFRPLVSPDGRLLVYGTRHDAQTGLRVRDLTTGDDRWLIWPIQRDEAEASGATRDLLPGYAFTPDGREVILTFDGGIHAVNVATGGARNIPFEAHVSLDVGPELRAPYRVGEGPVRARLVQSPRFSPDGRRVAFSVLTRLYTMDVPAPDSANPATMHATPVPRLIETGGERAFQPAWSPDGRWLAYVTWEIGGGHIWRVASDGRGRPQRLTTTPAFYTDLAYSPDGTRLVALRGNAFMRTQTFSEFGGVRVPLDVVWLPAAGGDVSLIVPARGLGTPHFAGSPDRVYVYSRDGLMSMRYDGTDRRTHLRVTGRPNPRAPTPPAADAVIMRPGGGHALASSGNQLYVMAVPPTGGDAPTVAVTGGGVPVRQVTDIGADYFGWSDDGSSLYWAIGASLFRRPFESIVWRDSAAAPGAVRDSAAAPPPADSVDPGGGGVAAGDSAAVRVTAGAARDSVRTPRDREPGVQRFDVVLDFPRARPSGTIALRNARVITMRGDELFERGDIVVTDNRIAAVGASGSVTVPAGALDFDVTGRTIVPGFIDTHAHWEFRTRDVLEPHNWSLLANLAYGVTAGLDVQTATNDYFAYQDLVDTGESIGQRAFMTGPGIFSRNEFRSYDEVEAFLQRYQEHYRTPNIKSYMVGNRQQRQWVVNASKKLGLMPTSEGGRDMKLDITHAIDGMHGNEHSLPVTPLYDDVVQLYGRMRTAYTPTLLVLYGGISATEWWFQRENPHADPKLNRFYPQNWLAQLARRRSSWAIEEEHNFRAVAEGAARIQRAGGLIGVGGHGELQGLGYHWEMWSLAMGGMTPREVLQAATIDGARIIGLELDLGSIEPGKLADLVILDGNPLENIRNTNTVRWVMKNGELYEGDTLARVWPSARPLPRLWWWDGAVPVRR